MPEISEQTRTDVTPSEFSLDLFNEERDRLASTATNPEGLEGDLRIGKQATLYFDRPTTVRVEDLDYQVVGMVVAHKYPMRVGANPDTFNANDEGDVAVLTPVRESELRIGGPDSRTVTQVAENQQPTTKWDPDQVCLQCEDGRQIDTGKVYNLVVEAKGPVVISHNETARTRRG